MAFERTYTLCVVAKLRYPFRVNRLNSTAHLTSNFKNGLTLLNIHRLLVTMSYVKVVFFFGQTNTADVYFKEVFLSRQGPVRFTAARLRDSHGFDPPRLPL